jgi:ankyrin repeat protein
LQDGFLEVLGMGKASIRFGAALLLLAFCAAPAASADRDSIELAAARIVGKHGLGVDLTEGTRWVEPLHWAAINDQAESIARIIESGTPVDMRDGHGRTALMVAAAFGNVSAVEALITHGADVRATDTLDGNQALHFAAVAGRTEVARALVDHGAKLDARGPHDETPLHYAGLYGQRKVISFLIANGANPDATDNNGIRPIQYAHRRRQDAAAELLIHLGARPDNLRDAVNAGDPWRVQHFLAHGSDVDERDESWSTPLDLAAATGQVAIAVMLLDAGADIEAADEPAEMHPLHLAALGDHWEMARLLLDRGADLEAGDSQGRSPLALAAAYGNVAVGSELLAAGANPLARDSVYHDTPVHNAVIADSLDMVELLLSRGGDVNARSGNGELPLDYAASKNRLPMIEFLVAHGADPNMTDDAGATPVTYAGHHSGTPAEARAMLRRLGARD